MGRGPKVFTPADYKAADLLHAGIDHLDAAAALSGGSYRYLDSAGYLCHIAIELMLKAWVLHSTGRFEGTHPLQAQIGVLSREDYPLTLTERQREILNYISSFSELRYPSLKHPVEIGTDDIELVMEVAEEIWQQIPKELVEAYEAIPGHKKGNRVIMRRRKDLPRDLELETGITAK
jgi:HEPN domain-containing protein